jgi:thioredoxin 1
VSLAAAALACSSAESAPPRAAPGTSAAAVVSHAAAPATPPQAARPRLVFFMNPSGMPCRIQDDVLRGMPDLAARADLVYVKTTERADLPQFQRYGIRSLPMLIVTDASGRELRRATPGIQTDAQVRALLAL